MKLRSHVRLGIILAVGLAAGCASPFPRDFPRLATSESPRKRAETLPAAESAEVCITLADSLVERGFDVDAIGQYELARQYKPKIKGVAWKLGVLYDRVGEHKKAMTEFELALQETPRNADLLNDVGYAYYNRGKWPDAEGYFLKALAINPRHERAWTNLGMARAQMGQREAALEAFGKVVGKAEALANLGFILVGQGKPDEAKQAYRAALEADPDFRLAKAALTKLEQPPTEAQPTPPGAETVPGQPREKATPTTMRPPASNPPPVTGRAAVFVETISELRGPSAPRSQPDHVMPLPAEDADKSLEPPPPAKPPELP